MKKIDRHFTIDESLHRKVLSFMSESHNTYSEEICLMIQEAISNRVKQEQLNKINSNLSFLMQKTNLMYELLKQLYSDLELNNITDPKKSYALNEFYKKIRISKFDS